VSAPEAAAIADAVGVGLGPAVLAGEAALERVAIPGVGEDVAWLVRADDADHPMQSYVGVWPDGAVRVLSEDQPAFFDLVAATGADIRDASMALDYVRAFLEVTRGPMEILREVQDAGDVRWRPGSSGEEANRARFEAGPPIEPAAAEPSEYGFHVAVTLVVDQRIQRNEFEVGRDGSIRASHRVLADDLPLPIAR
jgi:hypothetical protein